MTFPKSHPVQRLLCLSHVAPQAAVLRTRIGVNFNYSGLRRDRIGYNSGEKIYEQVSKAINLDQKLIISAPFTIFCPIHLARASLDRLTKGYHH